MKLLSLRVAAFRRFAGPAAIEAFSDGVNVLCGPNEMGKSTMFHALEAAFLIRHKVTGAALDAMRPYAGGEPLVEVDFEAQGRRWRIRKQFGRGAGALLTDLDSGAVVARNAEAEERLASLTGRSNDLPGRARSRMGSSAAGTVAARSRPRSRHRAKRKLAARRLSCER